MKRAAIWSAPLGMAAFLAVALWPAPIEDPSLGLPPEQPSISNKFIDLAWDALSAARELCPSCAESLDRAEEQLVEATPDPPPPDPLSPRAQRVKP